MRIQLGTLKGMLREAALTASNLPTDIGLIVRESRSDVTMALVKLPEIERVLLSLGDSPIAVLRHAIVGRITAGQYDVWRVTNVKARDGYGPLLYRLAMQYATRRGSSLSSDPDGFTSSSAGAVWDKFAEQSDVEVVFLEEKFGDQRDIAYRLDGDDGDELTKRYGLLLSKFDRWSCDRLDDLLDGTI